MKYGFLFFLFIQSYPRVTAQTGKRHEKPTFPEETDYVVRQYTSENGLPQNTARDLLFDENGFCWIATENGLARFDGQRFRVYNNANTPAIRSSLFSIIFQTPEHTILTTSGYANSPILAITPGHKIITDTAATRIEHKFLQVSSGCIFDGTALFAHYRNHRPEVVDRPEAIDTDLLNNLSRTDTFEIINKDEMVACHNGDWYYLDNAGFRIIRLPSGLTKPGNRFFCLDGLFCSLTAGGEWRFFRNGKETSLTLDKSVTELVRSARLPGEPDFTIYRKGGLVLLRRNNDIYQLSGYAGVLKARLIFKDLRFLTDQAVRCFQYDSAQQRLFIGTVNAGLFIVTKKTFHTATFPTRDVNNNVVLAFELLPQGKILTGHGVLDEKNAAASLLFTKEATPDWGCFYKAADHSIWFGRGHRLIQYDSSFSRKLSGDTLGLDSYITSIVEDPAHTLWISLDSSLLKMENGHLRYLDRHNPFFVDHRIQSTAQVEPGKWWIATSDGLYAYDLAAGKMQEQPLLPNVYVRTIYRAKDGSIWLGTYGDGYYKYTGGKFTALPLDARQYLATAHTFLEDGKGFFWISTDHGLFRIRKKDLDEQDGTGHKSIFFYYFDKLSGMNTDEFNGGCSPSSMIDGKGNFYIPSMNGLLHFFPDGIRSEWPDKPILIDHVSVDSSHLDDKQPFLIKPDFNRMIVDITTPYYGSEANLQLEYKLGSIGDQWYPVGKEGRILINRLPYGKYALMIRKRNGWGPGEFTSSSLSFEVLPNWYNTRWFDILLAGLIMLLLILVYVFRTRILVRQNRRLQVKVDMRTAELEQSTVIKERLISTIMHDLRSPLFAQGLMIGYLEGNYKKLPVAELDDLLFQLNESNKRICQFSTDFLAWYNTRLEGFRLEQHPLELAPFVEEVVVFYRQWAERKGLSFFVDIPPGLFWQTDRNILAIVLRNLVDNAVKYTPTGNIHITAAVQDGDIAIIIKDTGIGIPATKINELLNHPEANHHKASSPYGYRLVAELAQLIQAVLQIESKIGKGTTITLSLRT